MITETENGNKTTLLAAQILGVSGKFIEIKTKVVLEKEMKK